MSDEFHALMARLRVEAGTNDARAAESFDEPPSGDDATLAGTLGDFPTLRQLMARELLRLEAENRISFGDVIHGQIEEAERTGNTSLHGETRAAREGTLITLLALTLRQRTAGEGGRAPFEVLSLFRASDAHSRQRRQPTRQGRPHGEGLGIDITRYDGHSFHGPTRDAFNGLLVLVRNLPAGIFEVGLPRVPREDWHDFERYQRLRVAGQLIYNRSDDFPKFSGHFRAPGPLMTRLPSVAWTGPNEFLNADLELRRSPSGGRGLSHDLRYFNHAANASLLRRAADESEGTIRLLFPDEPNHVHLTVDIGGAWTEVLDANRRARRAR